MRLALALVLLSSTALANPKPVKAADPEQMHADDCAKARAAGKTCVLDMSGDTIDGHGIAPNGTTSVFITSSPHTSLVHIRTEFIEQIIKSAEDL